MPRLDHVLWVGGGTGAGKTSVADALASRHDLQTYHYDFHDARDHSERIEPSRHLAMRRWAAMSPDERWVLNIPGSMARYTIDASRERFEMVLEDLAARPAAVPIVAEGFGLYPELVVPLIADARHAVWLLPTSRLREHALAARRWNAPEATSDAAKARANRLQRDALLTQHARETAASAGLTVIEVDIDSAPDAVTQIVDEHFAPTINAYARHRPPRDEAHDASMRDLIAGAFWRFLAACTRGHSVVECTAAPYGLQTYELGLLNSVYLAGNGGAVTEAQLREAVPTARNSRVGRERWEALLRLDLARLSGAAIEPTARGVEVLRELYAEVRAEIRRRTVVPADAGRVGEVLERMSYLAPLMQRTRAVRELWGEEAGTTLERLYRAIWELAMLRDALPASLWPSGVVLDGLRRDLESIIEQAEA